MSSHNILPRPTSSSLISRTRRRLLFVGLVLSSLLLLSARLLQAEDLVEFTSGAKSRGRVVDLGEAKRRLVFELQVGGRAIERVYPYSKIAAITVKGERKVITAPSSQAAGDAAGRSSAEIQKIIDTEGSQPPSWLAETQLQLPESLDLNWTEPAEGPWDNQKNVGQYVWDILNPNPNKWREAIKLMMMLRERHADDAQITRRAARELGSMYFRYFQDYPRAAYWWQQGKVSANSLEGVSLAECYWRLGSKPMALKQLDPKRIRVESIKLLGAMGETNRAVQQAEAYAKQAKEPHWALLAAGDACRAAGRYPQALEFYQRVLDGGSLRNADYDQRVRHRAEQSMAAIKQFDLFDLNRLNDGEYRGEAMGYEGPVEVTIKVRNHRLESVDVTKHREKQFYSALRDVPQQLIAKQSIKNIDATSRATITAEAIVSATAQALSK